MSFDRATQVTIAALALAGVVIRSLFVGSPGFPTDVSTFMAWAERLGERGPAGFYEPGYFSDYPPGFLYVLWALGALLDGDALRFAVKAVSIPFDVAIAVVPAQLAWRAGGARPAILAAALWLLAPGIVFAGAYWGQVDAVGTLPFLLALIAAGRGRWATAGALAGLAAMIKPQFGLALILILAAAAFEYIRDQRLRPVARSAIAALGVILALALPFRAGPVELIALVRSASETYPYTSLYAFNPWSIVADFWKPDDGLVVIGGVALAAGIAAAAVPLWWRRDVAAFLACGACAVFAFYFLPTRAHERYLFPAFALLLPFVALRSRLLVPYVALALAFFTTLYFVFAQYDLVGPPALLEATLFSRLGQVAIAALMTGLAGYLAWRLARGDAVFAPDAGSAAAWAAVAGPTLGDLSDARALQDDKRLRLPAGLLAGHRPTRRDLALALLVAIVVLGTRGFRLDHPRDMYFDEVYHARTAYELLAQRDVYEWTHPHLAKELMALGIVLFSGDRVVGDEEAPAGITAFAVSNEGLRAYGLGASIQLRDRGGAWAPRRVLAPDHATTALVDLYPPRGPVTALAFDAGKLIAIAGPHVVQFDVATGVIDLAKEIAGGTPTSLALANGRAVVGTGSGVEIHTMVSNAPPLRIAIPASALTVKSDGSEAYIVDPQGVTHVVNTVDGAVRTSYPASGPVSAIAHAVSAQRLFLARSDIAALDVIELEGGRRETVPLANVRTGAVAPATALALVPRSQFLYALTGDRLVVVETHGASPYAGIAVGGGRLAVDGTADELLVADGSTVSRVPAGRQALSWRLPGVIAGATLAFFIVLLACRLFASRLAPVIAGLLVIADGSMFAQARIGMNDVYVACFLIAGWYFVIAAHAPRRSLDPRSLRIPWLLRSRGPSGSVGQSPPSPALDLVIAGVLFGLAAASKWVAFYALGGLGLLSLIVTGHAYAQGRAGTGGPLDLLRGRGLNAAFLFVCFALVPIAVYLLSYVAWFGGSTIPYGWDLRELTQQMYWYHSGLTAPHPAGSPWWSWPLVLKPVYWYYGASEGGGSAVIYDAGNVVLFWGGLAAVVWCAVAAVRARSLSLGLVVFALAVQLVAWVPISRVLFFYHFFTALPWYFLALTAALVFLWERGRGALVTGYLALAVAAFAFFYPFVSGLPVPADQTGVFFILPTWQYDCQFYPAFRCELGSATSVNAGAVVARLAPAMALLGIVVAGWALLRYDAVRSLVSRARR